MNLSITLTLSYLTGNIIIQIMSYFLTDLHIRKDYLEPYYLFVGAVSLYSTVGLYQWSLMNIYETRTFIIYIVSHLFAFIAFSVGYNIVRNSRNIKAIQKNYVISSRRFNINLDVLIIVSFFVILCIFEKDILTKMIFNIGQGDSYSSYMQRDLSSTAGLKYFLEELFLTTFFGLFFYNAYKNGKFTIKNTLFVVPLIVYTLVSGKRAFMLFYIIGILFVWNYKIRKIRLIELVSITLIALFFLLGLSIMRNSNNIMDMFSLLQEDRNLISLGQSGEMLNPTSVFLDYIQAMSNGKLSFNLGYNYLNYIFMFIPKFIWPNRPLEMGYQYMEMFYPYYRKGTAKAFYVLADGYMAAGILGVVISMFIFGIITKKLYLLFKKNNKSIIFSFIYVTILYIVVTSVRGHSMILKSLILMAFPFIVCIILKVILNNYYKKKETSYT